MARRVSREAGGERPKQRRRSLRGQLFLLVLASVVPSTVLTVGLLTWSETARTGASPTLRFVALLPLGLCAALAAGAVGLLLAWRLSLGLVKPLGALKSAMKAVEDGLDPDGALDVRGPAEVGAAAAGFNAMVQAVRGREADAADDAAGLRAHLCETQDALAQAKAEAETANKAKVGVATALSHDIRRPMNGLVAMARKLAAAPAGQRRSAAIVARSGASLLALVDDVLDLSRTETHPLELACAPMDVAELAEDVAALFWPAASAKGLDLAVYVDPATPKRVEGDATRLGQVIGALVNNAVRFTATGGVLVEIEPDSAESLRISVRDTGAGVPRDEIPQLFDAFGLGLCKRLVEAMDGRFHVTSQVGKGTTFAFRLPATVAEAADPWPQANAEAPRAVLDLEGVSTRRALGRYLARAGYALAKPEDEAEPGLVIGAPAVLAEREPTVPALCVAEDGDMAAEALLKRGVVQALIAQPFRRGDLERHLRRLEAGEPLETAQPEPEPAAVTAAPWVGAPSPLPSLLPTQFSMPHVTVIHAAQPPDVKTLLDDLHEAIDTDQLKLVYQPQYDREGRQILGVETLVRWIHPERGYVSPVDFIPLAEAWGCIHALTDWVMDRAVAETAHLPNLQVAFNASALEFTDASIVTRIEKLLSRTGFDPKRLELEITETAILTNEDQVRENMFTLRDMGMKVALDDFGAGYSSLGHLRRYPFDKLKIDREFVTDCTGDVQSATVVHAVVSIGRALGMRVVAEGVETEQQRQFLKIAGVHAMQGYLFGKPTPLDDLKALLAEREPAKAHG